MEQEHASTLPASSVLCYAVPSYEDTALLCAAVESIFAACAAAQTLGAHSRVLLKPNLLAKHAPEAAVTTHPAVLRAVILSLQKRGVTHITVADSPGGVYNAAAMRAIYKVSGLADVCAETGATLYTGCLAAPRKTDGVRVHTLNLLEAVHEADCIINLPKLKTHVMTGMSCAVKNLFGTIPGLEKAELHMRFPEPDAFGEMLVDVCECVKPQMHIVDGIIGMEGDGPAGGSPRKAGLLLGGENPYAIDLFVCHLFSMSVARVPYLAAAVRRGLCAEAVDLAQVVCADTLKQPLANWQLPHGSGAVGFEQKLPAWLRPLAMKMQAAAAPHPVIRASACIGCGKCAEICPGHTIVVERQKARIVPQHCIRCFCCHEMCPVKAIRVKRMGVLRHGRSAR